MAKQKRKAPDNQVVLRPLISRTFGSHAKLETPGGVQPEPGEEVTLWRLILIKNATNDKL